MIISNPEIFKIYQKLVWQAMELVWQKPKLVGRLPHQLNMKLYPWRLHIYIGLFNLDVAAAAPAVPSFLIPSRPVPCPIPSNIVPSRPMSRPVSSLPIPCPISHTIASPSPYVPSPPISSRPAPYPIPASSLTHTHLPSHFPSQAPFHI